MTKQTDTQSRVSQFTESTWLDIASHVAASFRLTDQESKILLESRIAKLLASIPFLAGCENPERTSVSNLAIYMMSVNESKAFFNATPQDDRSVFARLSLARFEGGDQAIIDRGISLLAVNMIADYKREVVWDLTNGKHNPIANGTWDYDELFAQLRSTIEAVECPQMDEIVEVHEIVDNFWWTGYGNDGWF